MTLYTDLIEADTELEFQTAIQRWLEGLTHETDVSVSYRVPEWLEGDPAKIDFRLFELDNLSISYKDGAFTVNFEMSYPQAAAVSDTISNVDVIRTEAMLAGNIEVTEDAETGSIRVVVCADAGDE